jgi:hypothetical protein
VLLHLSRSQSTITAENTQAYKSLVEDPKELMLMQPIEVTSEEKGNTLPQPANLPLEHVPQSHKAATLSKLLHITKDFDASTSSPLKALRDMGKPRLRILPSVGSESVNSTTFLLDHDGDNPCETPSYMANAIGNFTLSVDETPSPLKSPTLRAEVKPPIERTDNNNPLPLPPRDRSTLQLNIAQKRHVRKHPLIIPATATQRTLDKFNQTTPVEDKSEIFGVAAEASNFQASSLATNYDDDDDDDVFEDLKKETKISQEFVQNVNHYGMIKSQEKNYTKDFIENNFPIEPTFPPTYQNLEDFQKRFSCHETSDTASLHFESILEDESDVKIPDDMVDSGFGLFDNENSNGGAIAKPTKASTMAQSSSINGGNNNPSFPFKRSDKKAATTMATTSSSSTASIEAKKFEFSQKFPKYKMPRNELASNALFNKIKESVEMAAVSDECEIELETENDGGGSSSNNNHAINHHVSCEDLLDFSERQRPQQGPDSDEVRIIRKMFGTKVV